MFRKVIHYIFSFKYIILEIIGGCIFFYFIFNSNISYEINDITIGEHKFYINSHYQLNRSGVKISPDKTFIILKYGPLPRRGGVWRGFISQQHTSNNNIHIISLLDDNKEINESLISNIHSIVKKIGVRKYILVFRDIDTAVIKQYTHKYGDEVEEVIYIAGISNFLYYDVKSDIYSPIPNRTKISFGKECFYAYDFMPTSGIVEKTFIILPSYSYFDAITLINENRYVPYEANKDFRALIVELVKNNNRVVVVEYFGYNHSGETTRKRNSDNICEEIHKVIEELKIKSYVLMPHSISGLYALDYVRKYRHEVEGIVGIDITLPYYYLEEYPSNEQYLQHKFNDDGKEIPESFKNMYTYFWETGKKLEGYKLDKDLPAVFFLSTQLKEYMNAQTYNGVYKTKIIDYINAMITNTQQQHIHVLEGTHYLYQQQSETMTKIIKRCFLGYK